MGLRARLVVSTTAAIVGAVLTLSIALAVTGAASAELAGWAAIGLAVGAMIGAGLVLATLRRPLRTIAAVREGLALTAGDEGIQTVPATGVGTADLARAFNEAAHTYELRLDAIRQSHAQLEAILRTMADGVVIVDEDEVVALMNPAAHSLLDVNVGEGPGRSLPDALRDHWLDYMLKAVQQQMKQVIFCLKILKVLKSLLLEEVLEV